MKVALCCIGRLENQYAVEYVEYYKKLGFDKIFIYDNNHDDEERFEDVLQEYVVSGFVEIIDFRNVEVAQLKAYNDCYSNHGNEYDWIAFFDFDEFLTLVKDDDIKSFLNHFEAFQCVKINWMVYTDNDLVINDHRPILERFATPMEYEKCIDYPFPENLHTKSIIKGGIEDFRWSGNPHAPNMDLKFCDSNGNENDKSPFCLFDYSNAYIKHFITKTIDEWINKKQIRGAGDRTKSMSDLTYTIDKFFKYNNVTEEKIEYINNIKHNNVDIFIGTQKTFEPKVTDKRYKIIVGNHEIENNSKLELIQCKHESELDDTFYSELYMLDYVSKNIKLKKYTGFCHNRRYFGFLDDIPNLDEIFSEYDCITTKPIIFEKSIKEQYGAGHNIEDLYIIGGIIADKYPEYANMWHTFINGNIFIPYNMFIIKSEDFKEYIKFMFDILDEYVKIVGTDIMKRIIDNTEKYLKTFYPNDTRQYQYRIGGYLGERLTNLFIMTHYKKIKTYTAILTEDKYKKE